MQRNHYQQGSVVLDRRTKTWFFGYRLEGCQKSVRLGKFATKKTALQAAEPVRTQINSNCEEAKPLVGALWEMYKQEKMPRKHPTRLAYSSWMRNHILPRWGGTPITGLQPRTVELWLKGLTLAPKNRVHIRGLLSQHLDDTKTADSSGELNLDPSVLQILKDWRQATRFREEEDWMWASPTQLGRLPISYPWFWRSFNTAAIKAGIGPLGTHTLRHTYRSWLDSVGTPVAVQQKLMRHSDIRTTMSYGDIVDGRMKEAHGKVASLVFSNAGPKKEEVAEKSGSSADCNVGSAVHSV